MLRQRAGLIVPTMPSLVMLVITFKNVLYA